MTLPSETATTDATTIILLLATPTTTTTMTTTTTRPMALEIAACLCLNAGIAVVERFKIALVPCGLLLLYSSYAIVTEGDEDEVIPTPCAQPRRRPSPSVPRPSAPHDDPTHTRARKAKPRPAPALRVGFRWRRVCAIVWQDLSENAIVQFTRRYLPSTDEYAADRFFIKKDDGAPI